MPGDTKPTTIPDGAISDDCEVNSWEESLTEEENSQGDDEYGEEDYGEEINDDPENSDECKSPDRQKLVINVACTQYDVIKKVAKKMCGFKL